MKKTLVLSSLLILLLSACYQKQVPLAKGERYCTISGHITDCGILSQMGISYQQDSVHHYIPIYVHGGDFTVRVPFSEARPALIFYNQVWKSPGLKGHSMMSFFLDTTDIRIEGRADSLPYATITGSPNQQQWDTIMKSIQTLRKGTPKVVADINAYFKPMITKARAERDTALSERIMVKLQDSINGLHIGTGAMAYDFVRTHPSSPVSAYALHYTSHQYSPEECINLYYSQDTSIQNIREAKKFLAQSMNQQNIEVGKTAPDFSFEDQYGNKRLLSSLHDKAIILDFWRLYCPPCRSNNKDLSRTYAKYHKDGLEIISIYSGERDKRWTVAVKKDSLQYISTTDPEKGTGTIFAKYGIYSTPYTLLIDRNHIIRARGNYIIHLEDSIAQLLK